MFTLSTHNKRWRISKDGIIVLSGIGSVEQAISIARLHDIALSNFNFLNYLKVA